MRMFQPGLFAAVFFLATTSFSQTTDRVAVRGADPIGGPVVGIPVDVDLRELPPPEGPIRVRPRWDPGDGQPVVDTPARPDPLLEIQRGFRGEQPDITEVHNFEGNHSAANPNDPTGDVGLNLFVQAINGPGGAPVTMYSKEDASLQAGPFALDSLAPPGTPCANGLGDPIVLYDHLAQRWLLTEFSSFGDRMCVYVSRTQDPIEGGWCFYEFADSFFPDYPKYGVWPDLYLATANQGNTPPVYAFDRQNMLSPDGESCPVARPPQKVTGAPGLPGLGFEAFTPVDLDGPEPPAGEPAYFVRHRDEELHGDPDADPDVDRIELWALDVDFDDATNTTFTQQPDVLVSDFDSNLCPPLNVFSCVPQPDGGAPLDPLLEVVMNRASYRNFGTHASILGVLQTDIGDFEDHSGERWMEIRRPTSGGDWTLFQEGTWSPDEEGRFMGTLAMDDAGNILLAYNVSSTTVFPSIRYTGRLASDPLGVMTLSETELGTGNGVNNSFRYGDYNQMGVDPVDGCTFWFLGMYNPNPTGDTKGVRIGAVKFDACGEPGFVLSTDVPSGGVCTAAGSADFVTDIEVVSVGGFEGEVTLGFDPPLPGGFSGDFDPNPVIPGDSSTATITADQTVAPDTYTLTVSGTAEGVDDDTLDLTVDVVTTAPAAPSLLTPPDGAIDVSVQPEFSWSAVDQTETYLLQVATDIDFTELVIDEVVEGTTFTPAEPLATNTTYFWRVRGSNLCGDGAFSEVFSFTTFPGPPIVDISPESFSFEVPQGGSDSDTLSIGNLGEIDLVWSITTDVQDGLTGGGMNSHDPALDEPLEIPGPFEIDPPINGGTPVVFTLPGGVLTSGDVVGFSFVGTVSGITGTGTWASDTCMFVEAPDGTTFVVGGFSAATPGCAENDWDFQGSQSENDGTYESMHDDVFPAVSDEGDWTITFVHDFDDVGSATITWSDITVTLHKQPLPVCDDVTEVSWLSVDPVSGATAPGESEPVDVLIDTADLDPGDFEAALCVATNDPNAPVVPVPVSLTVEGEGVGPIADISPEMFDFTVPVGGTGTQVLNIGNLGDEDLNWDIEEAEATLMPETVPYAYSGPTEFHSPVGSSRAAGISRGRGEAPADRVVLPAPQAQAVGDFIEGFDDITQLPGAGWAMINNSEPTGPSSWFQGNETVFPAHEGTPDAYIAANFDSTGDNGDISNWLLTPEVTIVNGTEMCFWTRTTEQFMEFFDRLEVRMSVEGDSTDVGDTAESVGDFIDLLLSINPDLEPNEYPEEWTEFCVEVRERSREPVTGRFAFRYWVTDSGANGSNGDYIGIDTVSVTQPDVEPPVGCASPTDIPWLSATPDTGTTAPGEVETSDITVDATELEIGELDAQLCVSTNDPNAELVEIPVHVTVIEDGGPPMIDVDPDSLESTLPEGGTETHDLTISNLGGGTLEWEVTEQSSLTGRVLRSVGMPSGPTSDELSAAARADSSKLPPAAGDSVASERYTPTAADEAAGIDRSPSVASSGGPWITGRARSELLQSGVLLVPNTGSDYIVALDPETGDVLDPNFISIENISGGAKPQALLHQDGERVLISAQTQDVVHAYDLETGDYLGVFAPPGGADTSIMDNIRGMAFHPTTGNLLVASDAGGNSDSVVEFDAEGNFLGLFINSGAGGISSPWSLIFRNSDALLSNGIGDGIYSFGHDGTFIELWEDDTGNLTNFPEQITEIDNGNVLAATFSSPSGVWEFDSEGALIDVFDPVTGLRGVFELANGNILVADGSGVHEINRDNELVETKIAGSSYMITPVQASDCALPTWVSVDPTSGSVPGGSSQVAEVTFDATGLDEGTHTGNLCIASNDPATPLVVVPLTLTVTPGEELVCFAAELTGDQEVPPVDTDHTGTGAFTYDFDTMELTWEVSHDIDLAEVVASHIHVGAIGENGPIEIPLDHTMNPIVGSATLTQEQEDTLTGELFYVNVHTNEFPGGEIRGQILPCEGGGTGSSRLGTR